jgi:acyl carrier protein
MSKKWKTEAIAKRVREAKNIVIATLGVVGGEVLPETQLDKLAHDDIDLLALYMELEDSFYIEIQEDTPPKTVQDCIDLAIQELR